MSHWTADESREGAERGDAHAMYRYGYCIKNGLGVDANPELAVEWYRKAADLGHVSAMTNLGRCYETGSGVAKDYAMAATWYQKAADKGNPTALNNLGSCYKNGYGVPQDYFKAVHYYKQAAGAGDALAMSNLADCYLNGRGVEKNHKTAVQWYEKSAGRENSSGMSGLAWCFEWGYGVEQNAAKAVEWYEKASKRGSTTAKRALERPDLLEAARLALARPAAPTAAVASASLRADAASFGDAGSSSGLTASVSYLPAATLGLPDSDFRSMASSVSSGSAGSSKGQAVPVAASAMTVGAGVADVDVAHAEAKLAASSLKDTAPAVAVTQAAAAAASSASTTAAAKSVLSTSALATEAALDAEWQRMEVERRARPEFPKAYQQIAAKWQGQLPNLLACPVCLKGFNVGEAVLLSSCLHTVCSTCAPNMVNAPCPVCEAAPKLPAATAALPLRPHPLIELHLSKSQAPRRCSQCDDQMEGSDNVVSECLECNQVFCEPHAQLHRRGQRTKEHQVRELVSSSAALVKVQTCAVHSQPLAFICTTCNEGACAVCATSTHAGSAHTLVAASAAADVLESARQRLLANISEALALLDELVKRAADAQVALADVEHREAVLRSQITASFQVIRQLVDTRERQLQQHVKQEALVLKHDLQSMQDLDQFRHRILSSTTSMAEMLEEKLRTEPAFGPALVGLEAVASERLTELRASAPAKAVPFVTQAGLEMDPALQTAILKVGRIGPPV